MPQKDNYIQPSKLSRFRSITELKSAPPAFPSTEPLTELQNEYKQVIAQLKSSQSETKSRPLAKTKKKAMK